MRNSDANAGERVKNVHLTDDTLNVDLVDGRTITVPLAWYPRLSHATPVQRAHWRICGGGFGLHWPEIDEDLSTEGLLRGAPAPRRSLQFGKQGLAMAYDSDEASSLAGAVREPNGEYVAERVTTHPAQARIEDTLMRVVRSLPTDRREEVLDYALFVKARAVEKATDTGIEADQRAWARVSIRSLAKYWDTPEEDAAWAYLQEGTSS